MTQLQVKGRAGLWISSLFLFFFAMLIASYALIPWHTGAFIAWLALWLGAEYLLYELLIDLRHRDLD